ncbi:MAG: hypothetical protein AMXMBFR84_04720 [Candidatus Hydrogenedentota bacterium]
MAAASGGNVLLRTVTGVTLLSISLAVICIPSLNAGFAILVTALSTVGLYEVFALSRARGISPETIGAMLSGALVTASGYFESLQLTNFMLYTGCLMVAWLHVVRGQLAVAGLAATIFGIIYVGWFGAHLILLHRLDPIGPGMVIMLLVAVVLTDTAAFFVGRAIGKHKLAPKVSPNKTWEGAAGGFLFAVVGTGALYWLRGQSWMLPLPDWSVYGYLVAGGLLSVASQVGDLTESALKRDAGVKDSGRFLPGHGGALDRCDGILFAAPFLYYMTVDLF